MARTDVTPLLLGTAPGDIAEPAGTTIDATLVTNGVRLLPGKHRNVFLRVSNTSAAGKSLIFRRPTKQQDMLGTGITDLTTTAIAATTGVRIFGPFAGGPLAGTFLQADGGIYVDFQAGHTGVLWAYELP